MDNISVETVVLIGVLVVLVIFVFSGCKIWCDTKKDHFTRTCISSDTNSRFVRSPVDYAMNVDEQGWHRFPHYMAKPSDYKQPLNFAPIDFYADERKLNAGSDLWQQYGNFWGGCGNDEPYIVNDNKTRTLLREVGDEGLNRLLNNMGGPEYGPGGASKNTELQECRPDPYIDTQFLYMGEKNYNKPIGS